MRVDVSENRQARVFPSWNRRGGCAIKKKIPFRSGADGVVRPARLRFRRTDHPGRARKEASRHFLDGASTLLSQEGNTLALSPSNTQRLLVREDIDCAGSLGRVVVLVAVDTS